MSNSFFAAAWAFIKRNKFAVLFSLLGIVLAVLFICIGFWKTILIAVLAGVGCLVGLFFDGRIRRRDNDNNPFGFGG